MKAFLLTLTISLFLTLQACSQLPYWTSAPKPTVFCYNYKLTLLTTETAWSYWFDYTDCFGVVKRIDLLPQSMGGPAVVYICSSSVPVYGDNFPFPTQPQATSEALGNCGGSASIPVVPCNTHTSYDGGYTFPNEQIISLGSGYKKISFWFLPWDKPDKFQVLDINGNILMDTGYRGGSTYQIMLNAELEKRGLPPEQIQGADTDVFSFDKTPEMTDVLLRVYAPISGSKWGVDIFCQSKD